MKASLKFREEKKPLFKSKVPISILGLPFQSALTAGDSKELSLSLATFFDYGPSFCVSYRPNNPVNPFSLTLKSGSPLNAPITMSAQFNFLGESNNSLNPRFMIHFKPSFGDFCVKKSHSSVMCDSRNNAEEDDVDGEVIERSECFGYGGRRMTGLPLRTAVETAVGGMEVGANTSLPIRSGAVLRFRWGVKFPASAEGFRTWFGDPAGRILPRGVPVLVLSKIGVEHVAKADKKGVETRGGGGGGLSEGAELAEACFGVKRELETLRFQNAGLGAALEELKAEFGRGRKLVKCDGDENGEIKEVSRVM
ncbi:hypothetical protein vseg_014407 [Gypsophila vaccaria]